MFSSLYYTIKLLHKLHVFLRFVAIYHITTTNGSVEVLMLTTSWLFANNSSSSAIQVFAKGNQI